MLSEHSHKLLAGYVDGELSARQREQVLKLLQQSVEARNLLRKLQEDAEALRRLPPPRLDRDLSELVVRTILERKLRPTGCRPVPFRPPVPSWLGLAAAAAVVLGIGLASYFYFANPPAEAPNQAVAKKLPAISDQKGTRPQAPEPIPEPPRPVIVQKPPADEKPAPPTPPAVVADKPKETPKPEKPAAANTTALTAPVPDMDMFQPATANVSVPFLFKLRELELEPRKQEFRSQLAKDKSYRVELPCRDTVRAIDRVQTALKANGFALIVEQSAQNWLKQPRLKANCVVYLEDVLPEELIGGLLRIRTDDRAAEAKRTGDGQFETVVLNAMTKADHRELTELIGVDPTVTPPKAGPLSGVDARKPVSDATADHVAQALAGQGGAPRPDPAKPATKPADRQGLVMTFNPIRPQRGSAEVKRFLDGRKPARTGTLQILLVLRGT